MIELMVNVLRWASDKVKPMRYGIALAGVAAAMALGAYFLRDYFGDVAGVVIAVNMGLFLMMAIAMFAVWTRARGKPYGVLFFIMACVFCAFVAVTALLSLTSVFYHTPLDLGKTIPIERQFTGDYRVDESVVLIDLRNRIPTEGRPGVESKDPKRRIDRVVRQRPTDEAYQMQSGTNGLRVEGITSPTHASMTTEEVTSARFKLTTAHTYIHRIAADRFPIGEAVTVEVDGTFVNAFSGEHDEWTGVWRSCSTQSVISAMMQSASVTAVRSAIDCCCLM